jgi:gas vesicle protein
MKGFGYFSAFLVGAVAGTAIGLLVAPAKGSETREKISETLDEFLSKHNIKLNRKEVGDLIDDLENAAE